VINSLEAKTRESKKSNYINYLTIKCRRPLDGKKAQWEVCEVVAIIWKVLPLCYLAT